MQSKKKIILIFLFLLVCLNISANDHDVRQTKADFQMLAMSLSLANSIGSIENLYTEDIENKIAYREVPVSKIIEKLNKDSRTKLKVDTKFFAGAFSFVITKNKWALAQEFRPIPVKESNGNILPERGSFYGVPLAWKSYSADAKEYVIYIDGIANGVRTLPQQQFEKGMAELKEWLTADQISSDELINGIESADPIKRIRSIRLLGAQCNENNTKIFKHYLLKDNVQNLSELLYSISMIKGDAPCEAILSALKNGSLKADVNVIEALGKTGSTKAIPYLAALMEHKREVLRYKAVMSLTIIGTDEVIPLLKEGMKDHVPYISKAAFKGLVKIGWTPPGGTSTASQSTMQPQKVPVLSITQNKHKETEPKKQYEKKNTYFLYGFLCGILFFVILLFIIRSHHKKI